jgi:hypothetical protein
MRNEMGDKGAVAFLMRGNKKRKAKKKFLLIKRMKEEGWGKYGSNTDSE